MRIEKLFDRMLHAIAHAALVDRAGQADRERTGDQKQGEPGNGKGQFHGSP
jgi:hypothetical protein